MLRPSAAAVAAVVVAAAVLLAAPRAHAQQDPEVGDRDDRAAAEQAESAEQAERAEDAVSAGARPIAPIAPRWLPRLEAKVRAGAGAVSGDTINPGTGAMSLVEGRLVPRATRGRISVEAPLELGHRQTLGSASLSETRGRGTLRGTVRLTPRVRLSGELGLGGSWKPGWPDPFQPLEGGGFAETDRYSHWDRAAGADLVVRPARRQRVRVAYDYLLAVYDHDPSFDAIYDPNHLTPWDRETHRLDASWRLRRDRWKLRAGAEVALRRFFYVFSGDAKTGVTHAGPGGEPPNPLLEQRWLKPRLEVELELVPSLQIGARYELELVQDTFEGYLSYVGHHQRIDASWALPRDAELRARAELFVRRYGENSYDYGDGEMRPPLSWGSRRADVLGDLGLTLQVPFAPHWSALADARFAVRRTNYAYSIDWDYFNWAGWAGAEYRY
jgi:hypothetical protein